MGGLGVCGWSRCIHLLVFTTTYQMLDEMPGNDVEFLIHKLAENGRHGKIFCVGLINFHFGR